ncbi:set domain-containing protein [Moniliophthora roreri MCA 2997]|uniref:Set domain-containing protein n=1 Tax=Moniliophthora roreri (strain MCA 2997) TaxID=1381753 RepID=V2WXQ3_MONRO|nr:set domain-containing protein [Moniliophthora roreri MCA 2997]
MSNYRLPSVPTWEHIVEPPPSSDGDSDGESAMDRRDGSSKQSTRVDGVDVPTKRSSGENTAGRPSKKARLDKPSGSGQPSHPGSSNSRPNSSANAGPSSSSTGRTTVRKKASDRPPKRPELPSSYRPPPKLPSSFLQPVSTTNKPSSASQQPLSSPTSFLSSQSAPTSSSSRPFTSAPQANNPASSRNRSLVFSDDDDNEMVTASNLPKTMGGSGKGKEKEISDQDPEEAGSISILSMRYRDRHKQQNSANISRPSSSSVSAGASGSQWRQSRGDDGDYSIPVPRPGNPGPSGNASRKGKEKEKGERLHTNLNRSSLNSSASGERITTKPLKRTMAEKNRRKSLGSWDESEGEDVSNGRAGSTTDKGKGKQRETPLSTSGSRRRPKNGYGPRRTSAPAPQDIIEVLSSDDDGRHKKATEVIEILELSDDDALRPRLRPKPQKKAKPQDEPKGEDEIIVLSDDSAEEPATGAKSPARLNKAVTPTSEPAVGLPSILGPEVNDQGAGAGIDIYDPGDAMDGHQSNMMELDILDAVGDNAGADVEMAEPVTQIEPVRSSPNQDISAVKSALPSIPPGPAVQAASSPAVSVKEELVSPRKVPQSPTISRPTSTIQGTRAIVKELPVTPQKVPPAPQSTPVKSQLSSLQKAPSPVREPPVIPQNIPSLLQQTQKKMKSPSPRRMPEYSAMESASAPTLSGTPSTNVNPSSDPSRLSSDSIILKAIERAVPSTDPQNSNEEHTGSAVMPPPSVTGVTLEVPATAGDTVVRSRSASPMSGVEEIIASTVPSIPDAQSLLSTITVDARASSPTPPVSRSGTVFSVPKKSKKVKNFASLKQYDEAVRRENASAREISPHVNVSQQPPELPIPTAASETRRSSSTPRWQARKSTGAKPRFPNVSVSEAGQSTPSYETSMTKAFEKAGRANVADSAQKNLELEKNVSDVAKTSIPLPGKYSLSDKVTLGSTQVLSAASEPATPAIDLSVHGRKPRSPAKDAEKMKTFITPARALTLPTRVNATRAEEESAQRRWFAEVESARRGGPNPTPSSNDSPGGNGASPAVGDQQSEPIDLTLDDEASESDPDLGDLINDDFYEDVHGFNETSEDATDKGKLDLERQDLPPNAKLTTPRTAVRPESNYHTDQLEAAPNPVSTADKTTIRRLTPSEELSSDFANTLSIGPEADTMDTSAVPSSSNIPASVDHDGDDDDPLYLPFADDYKYRGNLNPVDQQQGATGESRSPSPALVYPKDSASTDSDNDAGGMGDRESSGDPLEAFSTDTAANFFVDHRDPPTPVPSENLPQVPVTQEELTGRRSSRSRSASSTLSVRRSSRWNRVSSPGSSLSLNVTSNEPRTPGDASLSYGGLPVLTWKSFRSNLANFTPPCYWSKDLPHAFQDHINWLSPEYRNSRDMQHVFESIMVENTSEEPQAPAIKLVNEVDYEPTPPWEFYYTNKMWNGEGVPAPTVEGLGSCDCVGACNPRTCVCVARQQKWTHEYHEGFLYDDRGCVRQGGIPAFECNSLCGCDERCKNRVVQHGRKCEVVIFKTREKGWGVKNGKKKIPMGSFIGIYSGEILLDDESEERGFMYDKFGRTYLFDLNMYYLDNDCKYTIDAYHAGNFTRFLNHSCDPNAMLSFVYIDEADIYKPLLCIFARRDIAPNEEITFSYAGDPDVDDDDEEVASTGRKRKGAKSKASPRKPKTGANVHKPCRCGAKNCKGVMWR